LLRYARLTQASAFDEAEFFRAIAGSGVRALLIGRRGLVALGMPVMTRDYDFWIPADDAAAFNAALLRFDMFPSCSPDAARARGRYALENDEHVDILVARSISTVDGTLVHFDDVWARRIYLGIGDIEIAIPSIDDYILTKRFGARPRDADDIRWLEHFRDHRP
jgi:hypothetical protein